MVSHAASGLSVAFLVGALAAPRASAVPKRPCRSSGEPRVPSEANPNGNRSLGTISDPRVAAWNPDALRERAFLFADRYWLARRHSKVRQDALFAESAP